MELNGQWRKGRGEGAKMTIPQLLAHADSALLMHKAQEQTATATAIKSTDW